MMSRHNNEKGQAIVLIAFAFIALMAFAALAIDGGMVYSDRRHAQNATDAGSLAGGGAAALILENEHVFYDDFDCGLADINAAITAAENAAQSLMLANEYAYADISVTTECQDSDTRYFEEKYLDIITQIVTETRTSLIQVVWDGTVQNIVNATTRVKPRVPLAFGHAIVGLNPGDGSCAAAVEGVKLGGTGEVTINGGGIWSQGCLSTLGDCEATVEGGGIAYGGGFHDKCDDVSPSPQFQDDSLPEDSYHVPEPSASDCAAEGAVSISDIKLSGKTVLNLDTTYPNATLICLTSSKTAIQMTGGVLTSTHKTLYLQNGGSISINGGVANLSAPAADPDPDPGIPGVLIYLPGSSSIIINGNGESSYLGLIYAPKSDIEISGTGEIPSTFNTQIIGWNVSLLGNATVDINFNETWNYAKPTSLDLQK